MEQTSLVGRRRELTEIKRLLGEFRLVTLIGTGGVGKTRLAQRVAGQKRRAFAHGVWFVDLTSVRDPALSPLAVEPELLAHVVTVEMGLRQQSTRGSLELLTDYLQARSALLVLDDCEYLIPACAELADQLLVACPELRILATSREPLGIAGEGLFIVPPLPVPTPGQGGSKLLGYESVALFVARGETSNRGFRLDQDNQAAVSGICRRLDGLPLAIELAASWLPVLAPQQILDRFADGLLLQARRARSAPKRQQTLRACIDWSYELCSESERLLWSRLSVFVTACELDSVEGVCTDDRLLRGELLEVLAGLVERSVLIRDTDGQVSRYRMLETLKQYGREKLEASGEDAEFRRRHRDWFAQTVEQAQAEWMSDRQASWSGRLGRVHSDLRAAVESGLAEPGEAGSALRMTVNLPAMYWRRRGLFSEGRRWLALGLAKTGPPADLRARALILDSELAFIQGDMQAGRASLAQGTQLAEQVGDSGALANALLARGLGAMYTNELSTAVHVLEQGLEILPHVPDPDLGLRAQMLYRLGRATALVGDYDRALACAQEVVTITEAVGEIFLRSHAMRLKAFATWRQGNLDRASEYERSSMHLSRAIDDRFSVALELDELAWISVDQHKDRQAATLLGLADKLSGELAAPISTYQHRAGFHDKCLEDVRTALGDAAFRQAFTDASELTYEAALAFALEQPDPQRPAPRAATLLTSREREVADLVAEGLSNKEIATRLVISQRTAETHVQNVLIKLGFTSRTQVAAWIAADKGSVGP
ncbi:ATP-binding protein [Nocardioides sp. AN3]